MLNIKTLFFVLFSFILISCTATEPFDEKLAQQRWSKHKQQLSKVNAFKVNGSIAYFSDRTRSFGRFLITQKNPKNYSIKITSPVGTSVMAFDVTPARAKLTDQNGTIHTAKTAEELLSKISRINIPFSSLHNWLKGASDNPNYDQIDAAGRLVETKFLYNNNLWKLSISEYMVRRHAGQKLYLPAMLELNTQLERFRLTISDWTLQ